MNRWEVKQMDEQFVHEDQMRNARTQGVGSMVSEQNRQNALYRQL